MSSVISDNRSKPSSGVSPVGGNLQESQTLGQRNTCHIFQANP